MQKRIDYSKTLLMAILKNLKPWLNSLFAARDGEDGSGDVGIARGNQEIDRFGDFIRFRRPAHRDQRLAFGEIAAQALVDIGVGDSRADRID